MDELNTEMVQVRVAVEGRVCHVALDGELDIAAADTIREAVERALPADAEVEFDLSALRFMDSSGIAMMLAIAERARSVRLIRPSPVVRRIIEVTGLAGVLAMDG